MFRGVAEMFRLQLKLLRCRLKMFHLQLRLFCFHRRMLRFHEEVVRLHQGPAFPPSTVARAIKPTTTSTSNGSVRRLSLISPPASHALRDATHVH
jgi:hypothetical protein